MTALDRLYDKLDKNMEDFRTTTMARDKQEIYDSAGQISAMEDAHYYLKYECELSPEAVAYLLRLDNPLRALADRWEERCADMSDISFCLEAELDDKYALNRQTKLAEKKDAPDKRPSVLEALKRSETEAVHKPPATRSRDAAAR